ncbi:MAG TPA: hypothetical protein VGT42_02560, partial [Gammaproteobacteria bacterium]|nr:hypothetical protein [Gammaproteobacteria bacterium]
MEKTAPDLGRRWARFCRRDVYVLYSVIAHETRDCVISSNRHRFHHRPPGDDDTRSARSAPPAFEPPHTAATAQEDSRMEIDLKNRRALVT